MSLLKEFFLNSYENECIEEPRPSVLFKMPKSIHLTEDEADENRKTRNACQHNSNTTSEEPARELCSGTGGMTADLEPPHCVSAAVMKLDTSLSHETATHTSEASTSSLHTSVFGAGSITPSLFVQQEHHSPLPANLLAENVSPTKIELKSGLHTQLVPPCPFPDDELYFAIGLPISTTRAASESQPQGRPETVQASAQGCEVRVEKEINKHNNREAFLSENFLIAGFGHSLEAFVCEEKNGRIQHETREGGLYPAEKESISSLEEISISGLEGCAHILPKVAARRVQEPSEAELTTHSQTPLTRLSRMRLDTTKAQSVFDINSGSDFKQQQDRLCLNGSESDRKLLQRKECDLHASAGRQADDFVTNQRRIAARRHMENGVLETRRAPQCLALVSLASILCIDEMLAGRIN